MYGYECDYWSLGCVIYELITGQTPFHTAFDDIYLRILDGKVDYNNKHLQKTPLVKHLVFLKNWED